MDLRPEILSHGGPSLVGIEGELLSVSIGIDPRLLERLLETLAELPFPVNPQIYHLDSEAVVEFPAYAGHLAEIREALARGGFDPGSAGVKNMLEQIRAQGYNTNWKAAPDLAH